jgi:hypothetical protein
MMRCVPDDVKVHLAEFYRSIPHKGVDVSQSLFPGWVGNKIYSEWVKKFPAESHLSHPTKGLSDFINRETHYSLERSGYRWNGSGFEGLDCERYFEFRQLTIRALVNHSINILKNRKMNEPLLDSLKDWF